MNDEIVEIPIELPEALQTGPNRALPISGLHGVCASYYSPDDLDRRAVDYAEQLVQVEPIGSCLSADLGCSPYFPQAMRFAKVGLRVHAFDIEKPIDDFGRINNHLGNRIKFVTTDLSSLNEASVGNGYQLVYANRLFSHLRFNSARRILEIFSCRARHKARFFFSASSIDSDLAEGYRHRDSPIEERYAAVDNPRSRENQISGPLCLYSCSDIPTLIRDLPLELLEQFTSTSGSIKVVAQVVAVAAL